MFAKIARNGLTIIAPTIVPEATAKQRNTDDDTRSKILSKLGRALWSGTQLDAVDWSNLAAVKLAVNEHGYMDITMITRDQWMSDGSVLPVTTSGTPSTERD